MFEIQDHKLLDILLNEFTTDEEQLFVKSFYIYLKYGIDNNAYVIDLDDIWQWLGYSKKDKAKHLLIKYFIINEDYKIALPMNRERKNEGGFNKENIIMNVITFKKYCLKTRTDKASQIQVYYIKMETIMFKYIEETNKILIKSIKENSNKEIEINKHEMLKKSYSKKPVVYIMKMQIFEDDSYIIKIGESDDIEDRVEKLNNEFNCKVIILDIFECYNNKKFESHIHEYPTIKDLRYYDIVNNIKTSRETFLIKSNLQYDRIIRIIKKQIIYFKEKNKDIIILCNEQLKLENQKQIIKIFENDPDKLLEAMKIFNFNIIDQPITSNDKVIPENKIEIEEITHTMGPKVQIYELNDFSTVTIVYDSITEATRKHKNTSYSQIKFAAINKTPYVNKRWHLIDRNIENSYTPQDIGETVSIRQKKMGYIAMLNLEKTVIKQVFVNQKEAAKYIEQFPSVISNALKYNITPFKHYWKLWDEIDETLQHKYLENNVLPSLINVKGVHIHQIDPETNKIIETHLSITDVAKKFKISPRKIKSLCESGAAYKKYIWKIVNFHDQISE
jgi:hypothetical protein